MGHPVYIYIYIYIYMCMYVNKQRYNVYHINCYKMFFSKLLKITKKFFYLYGLLGYKILTNPTLLGPFRFWIYPKIFRSNKVKYTTPTITIKINKINLKKFNNIYYYVIIIINYYLYMYIYIYIYIYISNN